MNRSARLGPTGSAAISFVRCKTSVPMTVTDRAYTSPIWHTPAK